MAVKLSQYVSIFSPKVLQFAEMVRLDNAVHLVNAKAPMESHATRAVFSFAQPLKAYFPHVFPLAGTVTSAMAVC